MCEGGPRVDPRHGGRDSHPPREEAQGASHPVGYPCHSAQDGQKGPGTPSGKTLLYASSSARSGGPPLPHSSGTESRGSGPGLAIARISSGARQLECARPSGGVSTNAPGRDCQSRAHPPIWGFVTHRASEREACGSTGLGQVRIWSSNFLGPETSSITWYLLLTPKARSQTQILSSPLSSYKRPPSLRQSPRLAWRHRAQVQTIIQLSP